MLDMLNISRNTNNNSQANIRLALHFRKDKTDYLKVFMKADTKTSNLPIISKAQRSTAEKQGCET
jgi:hypothetical protein